jgi:hypothetical protein
MHVLEVFDAQATKWRAIERLAKDWGVSAQRIMAIGDEINDLDMVRNAGLGVAMGNAVAPVRDVARKHTARHDEDGVALAIEAALRGEW